MPDTMYHANSQGFYRPCANWVGGVTLMVPIAASIPMASYNL